MTGLIFNALQGLFVGAALVAIGSQSELRDNFYYATTVCGAGVLEMVTPSIRLAHHALIGRHQ